MSNRLTETEKLLIRELKSKDVSSREISRILWNTDSRKSTVNDFLSRDEEPLSTERSNILIWDVETAPSVGYFWGRWKQNIGQSQIVSEPFMLTWSAKWLYEHSVIERKITDYGYDVHDPENERQMLEELLELIDSADYIVAHNGDRFDMPTFNTRCLFHGLSIPSPSKQIDTLKIAKQQFKFPSNSLDSLSEYLNLTEKKTKVGFNLWRGCMENDHSEVDRMAKYCSQDVFTLEQVYLKLRPYDARHPNVTLKGDLSAPRCTKCGSYHVEKTENTVQTNVSLFEHYKCNNCGANLRGRTNMIDKEVRGNILANVT